MDTRTIHAAPKPPDGIGSPPRLWGWHTILSAIVTLALLSFLATFIDWPVMWREFLACNKGFLILAGAFHYLTYPVRGARWRRCLAHLPIRGSCAKFGLVVFFYNFVDNVVPAKLGDIYAAHMARINFGIRRSEAIGSIVFLRMLDAWIILSAALLSSLALLSTQLPKSVLWALIGGGFIAAAATGIMVVFFFLDRSLPHWIPDKIRAMIRAFRKGMWPQKSELLPVLGLTTLIWALEILWIYFLTYAFGQTFGASEVLFLTTIPLLASVFPLTPSGAGVVEVTLFSCLRVLGVPTPVAGSITLLNRFIDYWLHIGLGVVVWVLRHRMGLRTWREVTGAGPPGPGAGKDLTNPEKILQDSEMTNINKDI